MTQKFLRTVQRLYMEGHYRLISYEPNSCTKYQEQKYWNAYEEGLPPKRDPPHFNYMEIVFKKLSPDLVNRYSSVNVPISEYCS